MQSGLGGFKVKSYWYCYIDAEWKETSSIALIAYLLSLDVIVVRAQFEPTQEHYTRMFNKLFHNTCDKVMT